MKLIKKEERETVTVSATYYFIRCSAGQPLDINITYLVSKWHFSIVGMKLVISNIIAKYIIAYIHYATSSPKNSISNLIYIIFYFIHFIMNIT